MVKQLKIWKRKLFHQIVFPCWCRCRCWQTLTDIWVCQVVEHQQCAHRLLDRHTILTSSTMIWVTVLIIVLHRESWEGFCCFKILISVWFLFFFLVVFAYSVLMMGSQWNLEVSVISGMWTIFLVYLQYLLYVDHISGTLTIFLWTLSPASDASIEFAHFTLSS